MSFENRDALHTEIADWLNREDLTAQSPSFVRLFEARANRVLRTHDMVKRATVITDDQYFIVPADWRETIAFLSVSGGRPAPIEFVTIDQSLELRRDLAPRRQAPSHYTHMDGKFFLLPAPDGVIDLELIYRAAIPVLTADNPSNWLLDRSPDLYLFGALAEAEPYLRNDDRVTLWQSKANGIIADMQYEAERASFPQGKLKQRIKAF